MLYQNYPRWEKVRSSLLDIDPAESGMIMFSRSMIEYFLRNNIRTDGGVSSLVVLPFIGILEDCFGVEKNDPHDLHTLGNYMRAESTSRRMFHRAIVKYVLDWNIKRGNRLGYLRYYSPSMRAFDLLLDHEKLPEEQIIPMSVVHSIIGQVDKNHFIATIAID